MNKNAIYFGKSEFYDLIRDIGGTWNDSKERPIVCLIKLSENDKIYWAVPMGNWNHRNEVAKNRITKFMSYSENDIRSCFYHVGKTDVESIFFMSDVVPITDEYIERDYISSKSRMPYVIKNKKLIAELQRKLKRILSWENASPNYFRQHITDIKNYLIRDIEQDNSTEQELLQVLSEAEADVEAGNVAPLQETIDSIREELETEE